MNKLSSPTEDANVYKQQVKDIYPNGSRTWLSENNSEIILGRSSMSDMSKIHFSAYKLRIDAFVSCEHN